MSGGEGDLAAVCPICNIDKRNLKDDKREGTKELKGGTGGLSKKIERPVKMVDTVSAVQRLGKRWSQKSLKAKEARTPKHPQPQKGPGDAEEGLPPVSTLLPTPKR